jgi:hypothetical protein
MSRKVNIFNASCQDTDVLAFMAAAGLNDSTILNALCVYVTTLKTNSIYSKMKAVYPFIGSTAGTHKWNLINPADTNAAFRLQFFGGITHNSNGITGNSSNAYADTFFTPTTNFTSINNKRYSLYIRNNIQGGCPIGSVSGADIGDQMFPRFADNRFYAGNSSSAAATFVANLDARGYFSTSRLSNLTAKAYKNGSPVINIGASIAQHNLSFALLARRQGFGFNQYTSFNVAYADFSDGLTDAEELIVYNAVQALQTALSRQV